MKYREAPAAAAPHETPVTRFLDAHGVSYRRIQHTRPALTAQDVALQAGIHLAQVVKTMVLGAKDGAYVVALVPGDRRLDIPAVCRQTGLRLSLMRPQRILETTGYSVGAVAPFGLRTAPACLVADESLFAWDELNISSGHPLLSCQLASGALVPFVDGGIFSLVRPTP
ncbi:Cys-tRNA(Pro) deacylase [Desulfacinum hydrothermale DSM 13146]|uniref:Cys-tRNA(Pro) deacylase n=1 Tax=Desulfacinum hydrothermale DSM 13146 TaxID=1121390 RepID=A0A1W1X8K9_9BACT|nr:YbaK/EbsC family protein [Desulfacinum hydrothermale]SMC20276.1 Cys-tRNA(Pro) deacylase [Desulfacinum hydrothermale DSM 13146]